jgi:hypothetical protein
MGKRSQPRTSDPWYRFYNRVFRLGVLRSISYGAESDVQQS